jgi:hypothetical protein
MLRLTAATPLAALLLAAGCASNETLAPGAAPLARPAAAVHHQHATGPHAAFVIVVVMENRDYDRIIGSKKAPFINGTLVPQAALMTNSHAIGHPSQPNYLALFSGSTQGITDDSCPHSFDAPNLGAEAIAAGWTFGGYSESMPKDGFRGCNAYPYARKHNPFGDELIRVHHRSEPVQRHARLQHADRRQLAQSKSSHDPTVRRIEQRAPHFDVGRSRAGPEREEPDPNAAVWSDDRARDVRTEGGPLRGPAHD